MHSIDRRALLASALTLAAGSAAQASGQEHRRSLLEQVVPKPTGQNGYEDLVAAADLMQSSRLWKQAEEMSGTADGVPLAFKRRVLGDPPLVRALALLKRGLSKPIASPRKEIHADTLLPELAAFRALSRLLGMVQYVEFADGRTADAVETMRLGMIFSQSVQTDSLISGLVGVAINAITLRPVGDHLDELGSRDCEVLFEICAERLARGSRLADMLEAERRGASSMVDDARKGGPESLKGMFSIKDDDPDAAEQRQTLEDVAALKDSPERFGALLDDVSRRLDRAVEQAVTESRKPAWERDWEKPEIDGSLGGRLAGMLIAAYPKVGDKYAGEEALVRMLAVHAAIHRYRWEYDRLPQSLAALNMPDLVRDPFTGEHLKYEPAGRRYRLSSVGPEIPPDSPNAVNGRFPLTVGRE